MHPILAFIFQFVLILAPVLGFWFLKQRFADGLRRLFCAVTLAIVTGALAYFLSAKLGWQPTTRSGRALSLEPIWLFTAFAGGVLVVLLLMAFHRDSRGR